MELGDWSGRVLIWLGSFVRLDRPGESRLRLSLFSSKVLDDFVRNDFEDSLE